MPNYKYSVDTTGAVKGLRDLTKAIKDGDNAFEEAAKKATKMEKAAQRIAEQANPAERYNRKIKELGTLVREGQVSLQDAETVAAKYGRTLERAGTAGARTFQSAGRFAASFAAQFASVNAIVGAAFSALKEFGAEQQRLADEALQSRSGLGSLSQLAATASDPKAEFRGLLAEARAIVGRGAAENEDEAGQLLFSLVSAGLSRRDRDFAVKLRSAGTLSNIGGLATAYSAMTKAFGAEEVGSFEDFTSKALAASSVAPSLANEIPQAATRAAGSARALGLSDEFLKSATAIEAAITGDAGTGGTLIAAFLAALEKEQLPGIKGKSGIEIVEYLSTLREEQQGIGGVLGARAEAVAGYRNLRDNLDLLRQLQSEVEAAQANGLAATAIDLTSTDEGLRAAQSRARLEGTVKQESARDTAIRNLATAVEKEIERVQRTDDGGFTFGERFQVSAGRLAAESEHLFGFNREYAEGRIREAVEAGLVQDRQLLRDIADLLQDQNILIQSNRPVITRQE